MKAKGMVYKNGRDVHLNGSIIDLHGHTTGPTIHFYDLYSVFFNNGEWRGILRLIYAHCYDSQFKFYWVTFDFLQRK